MQDVSIIEELGIEMLQNPSEEDMHYMHLAVGYCNSSNDLSTHNGAVLLSKDGQYVLAKNGIPEHWGIKATRERLEQRPLKYNVIEHAENGSVFAAARSGIKTEGATVYCPWYACSRCAIALVCSGVSRIVGHTGMLERTPDRWLEDVRLGFQMLQEAGVKTQAIDKHLDKCVFMNGDLVKL